MHKYKLQYLTPSCLTTSMTNMNQHPLAETQSRHHPNAHIYTNFLKPTT